MADGDNNGENLGAEDQIVKEEKAPPAATDTKHDGDGGSSVKDSGNLVLRPVFLGNLINGYSAEDISNVFEKPAISVAGPNGGDPLRPIPVERVDLKRGYCFVFLKDAINQGEKARAEQFVSEINGTSIERVSKSMRAEFARGDGRIKRKEDDRRKKIQPSETLFVVNFDEDTTKREDLQMLFAPFGELVRIDMKRNYAFVQFSDLEDAKRAKQATNGGKLDQCVITVEYVAKRMGDVSDRRRDRGDRGRGGGSGGGGGGGGGGDRRGPPMGFRGRPPPPDHGRNQGGPPPPRMDARYDGGYRGGRDERHDRNRRDRSPPRDYRDRYSRGRSRSRSRSPHGYRHRSRSPAQRGSGRDYDDRDRDDYRSHSYRDGRNSSRDRDEYRGRGGSRERDRDRGYRP